MIALPCTRLLRIAANPAGVARVARHVPAVHHFALTGDCTPAERSDRLEAIHAVAIYVPRTEYSTGSTHTDAGLALARRVGQTVAVAAAVGTQVDSCSCSCSWHAGHLNLSTLTSFSSAAASWISTWPSAVRFAGWPGCGAAPIATHVSPNSRKARIILNAMSNAGRRVSQSPPGPPFPSGKVVPHSTEVPKRSSTVLPVGMPSVH